MAKMNILPNFGDKNPLASLVGSLLSGEKEAIGGTPISPPPIWTTKDGAKIPVTEMDDSHLDNSIGMVKRTILIHVQKIEVAQASLKKLELERLRRFNVKKAQLRAVKDTANKKRAEKKLVNRMQLTGRRFRED